jgi:hypothetical protein
MHVCDVKSCKMLAAVDAVKHRDNVTYPRVCDCACCQYGDHIHHHLTCSMCGRVGLTLMARIPVVSFQLSFQPVFVCYVSFGVKHKPVSVVAVKEIVTKIRLPVRCT